MKWEGLINGWARTSHKGHLTLSSNAQVYPALSGPRRSHQVLSMSEELASSIRLHFPILITFFL